MHYHFFPVEVMELQKEIQKHEPLLKELMLLHKDSNQVDKITAIATYCDVVLDGVYTDEDLLKLCSILQNKLRTKRGELVLDVVQSLSQLPS